MDYRLTTEDLNWLRKLREAKAANQPLQDIPPTSVLRKLTMLGCAQANIRSRSEGATSWSTGNWKPKSAELSRRNRSAAIGALSGAPILFCGA